MKFNTRHARPPARGLLLRSATIGATLLLAACASPSPDAGFGAIASTIAQRNGVEPTLVRGHHDTDAVRRLVTERLAKPLDVDSAVTIAIVNHPGLQATYWEAGIADADLAQAGRLQNPTFGFKRTHNGEVEIERSLGFNLVELLTKPLAARIEARRFEQVRLQVASAVQSHIAATRRAWFDAVAAQQSLVYARQVQTAADAAAELTQRMASVGNASALDRAQQLAFSAEAVASTVRATRAATAAREKLVRLLGLTGSEAALTLPDQLPALPEQPVTLADAEHTALRDRLDIQAARTETEETAASLGLTRTTRFINVLDLAYVRNTAGGVSAPGYEISLEIPLFDWGSARVAKAEAIYMRSASRLAQTVVDARSEAREAYHAYRGSYDVARQYRDQIIPLRKQVSKETLLRYNGMLIGVFELLADARAQREAVTAYIDALREFWTDDTNLQATLGGKLPPAAPAVHTTQATHKDHQP